MQKNQSELIEVCWILMVVPQVGNKLKTKQNKTQTNPYLDILPSFAVHECLQTRLQGVQRQRLLSRVSPEALRASRACRLLVVRSLPGVISGHMSKLGRWAPQQHYSLGFSPRKRCLWPVLSPHGCWQAGWSHKIGGVVAALRTTAETIHQQSVAFNLLKLEFPFNVSSEGEDSCMKSQQK